MFDAHLVVFLVLYHAPIWAAQAALRLARRLV